MPDVEEMESAFDTIGLGKIINDPTFKPFIQDLERQLNERFETTSGRLGISISDCVTFALERFR